MIDAVIVLVDGQLYLGTAPYEAYEPNPILTGCLIAGLEYELSTLN
jgi:hypothetical protein